MKDSADIKSKGNINWDFIKTQFKLAMEKLKSINAFKWLIAFVIVLFMIMLFMGIENIVAEAPDSTGQVYKAIGFGMIMIWVCIFICYFIWAVFFYNVNKGFNREKRERIDQAKLNRAKGLPYRKEDIEEAQDHPYKDETFGFPRGTVRGMIAFTLLYGALALLIVSFGVKNDTQSNIVFIDQLDFFKKAFLMMIAFYFGSHSLRYLYPDNSKSSTVENQMSQKDNSGRQEEEPQKPDIVVIPSKDDVAKTITVDDKEIPPIQPIDPMQP